MYDDLEGLTFSLDMFLFFSESRIFFSGTKCLLVSVCRVSCFRRLCCVLFLFSEVCC